MPGIISLEGTMPMEPMYPTAFRIPLPFLNTSLDFTWYGISIVIGVVAATLYASYEAKRRGQNPENVWDMFILIVATGIVGARIWYVITATLGGNLHYLNNPLEILHIRAGGTNIFGALMFGLVTILIFCKVKKLNPWMYMDFIGPGVLLGQGLARWGNFVNQELYGPPTTLPWGISIDAMHRVSPWNDLVVYPLSTRFHPAFLYETIYDLIAFALLVYLFHRFSEKWKVGSMFGAYLVAHGLGRFIIEFFRPDQPRIGTTDISYSRALATLFVIAGAILIYTRQRKGMSYPVQAEVSSLADSYAPAVSSEPADAIFEQSTEELPAGEESHADDSEDMNNSPVE